MFSEPFQDRLPDNSFNDWWYFSCDCSPGRGQENLKQKSYRKMFWEDLEEQKETLLLFLK